MGVVLAPANGKGAGKALIEAGACELYFGFHDAKWDVAFPHSTNGLNRMSGFGAEANTFSFEELLEEAEILMSMTAPDGKPPRLHCTFNSASYTTAQVHFIAETYLPRLAQAGFASIIVSVPELIIPATEAGLGATASTMCAVYNAAIMRFYEQVGATRVIIPRDCTTADIAALASTCPTMPLEVFMMRNGCVFADSHCLGQHCAGQPSLCRSLRESTPCRQFATIEDAYDTQLTWQLDQTNAAYRYTFHENTCGLCALWRFEQAGIAAYKVVGRGDNIEDLCADVALTAENITIAHTCATEQEYLSHMSRPEDIRPLCANAGLSCYYPEVRF